MRRASSVKRSPTEATMLAGVVVAVAKSRSRELMPRLHEDLVHASPRDVHGFRNIRVNMEVALSVPSEVDSVRDRWSVLVEP